jgi:hypothetical protein
MTRPLKPRWRNARRMGTFNDLGAAMWHIRGDFKSGAVWFRIRRGDRVMRMRFWSKNTREIKRAVRPRSLARAFHPKARSHGPITTPRAAGLGQAKPAAVSFTGIQRKPRPYQRICAAIGWGEPPDFWYPSMRGVAPSGCGAASPITAARPNDTTSAARLKEHHKSIL